MGFFKQSKPSLKKTRAEIRAERFHQERAEHRRKDDELLYGPLNETMICPHCTARGHVHTKPIVQKKGISGGKATAALFTGGLTMVATGLSRKEANTQAHCTNCNNTWIF